MFLLIYCYFFYSKHGQSSKVENPVGDIGYNVAVKPIVVSY